MHLSLCTHRTHTHLYTQAAYNNPLRTQYIACIRHVCIYIRMCVQTTLKMLSSSRHLLNCMTEDNRQKTYIGSKFNQ